MTKELEELGRTRVYGINFDTDSNVIRGESKPTLDKIVAVLKARPDWKLKIEGHTDSTGGDAHNRQLSQSRAESVKSYLAAGGVAGARLTTAAWGRRSRWRETIRSPAGRRTGASSWRKSRGR